MEEERRIAERLDAHINTVFLDRDGLNFGRIRNISHGGLFLECTKDIDPNSPVQILAKDSDRSVTLNGRVVHRPDSLHEAESSGWGVRFIDLDYRAKAARDDILISLMYLRHALPQWH